MDTGFSRRKSAFFPGAHKIDAPISGPRIADKHFMDTRIFLKKSVKALAYPPCCHGDGRHTLCFQTRRVVQKVMGWGV